MISFSIVANGKNTKAPRTSFSSKLLHEGKHDILIGRAFLALMGLWPFLHFHIE